MMALYVQTLLLIGGAYVLGAAVACLVRRSIAAAARSPTAGARRVDPLPEIANLPATARFGRDGEGAPAAAATRAAAAATHPERAAQDLQQIKGIDGDIAARLSALGVRRYEELAALTPQEVRRIGDALGLGKRLARENWIEQAQVLASGAETEFAKRRARGETASATPTGDEGEQRPAPVEPPLPLAPQVATEAPIVAPIVAPMEIPAQAPTEPRLAAAGPVAASPPPPQPSPATPEVAARAAFADPVAPAAPPSPAAIGPAPEGAPSLAPEGLVPEGAPPLAPERPTLPAPEHPAPSAARDNLLRVHGIDAAIAALLTAQGVLRYSQIAHWSAGDVARFERLLGIAGRIARENWIEQAQILSRGGDTAFSREFDRGARAAAPVAAGPSGDADRPLGGGPEEGVRASPADLGSLRSVRSQAYQHPDPGPQAAQRAAAQDKVMRAGRLDDLKRIRGIGVLIEKKLNSMGIIAYEQIANWTAEDIDRVSQSLDFKGRIERENWVEQARILASGGATEFARRVDRGELESGRRRG